MTGAPPGQRPRTGDPRSMAAGEEPVTGSRRGPGPVTGRAAGDRPVSWPRRRGWRPRRRMRQVLTVVTAMVVGLVAYTVVWFTGTVGEGPPGRPVVVQVAPGASAGAIAGTLSRQGVVASSLAFEAYLFLKGTPSISPGGYLLRRHDGFGAVLDRLTRGPDVFPVTVTVGTTMAELSRQVGNDVPMWTPASFAAAAASVRSPYQPPGVHTLDGLLAPGTYLVMPGETPATLLTQMVDRFDVEASRLGLASAAAADGLTPYQVVVVASVVEKEGYYPKNFGGVARVIYNRLHAGMPLQMDSTVLYALGQDGGTVTPADEQVRSPYNTYLNTGLPPTPICFPPVAALAAALHPPAGPWLYFELVTRNGTLAFERTLAQHEADIALAHSRGLP